MAKIFVNVPGAGILDYVTAWYIKAAQYMQTSAATVSAFVSTNSIAQGEQVGVLWNELFNKYGIKIHFAHRTFKWSNEAKGNAAVHVVIIGFANYDIKEKMIYEYENIKGEPLLIKVKNINPYLVAGKDGFVQNRKKPLCNVALMNYGSMPIDNGFLILDDVEKQKFIREEPITRMMLKPYTGGDEFINNKKRWCIWLKDINPAIIKQSRLIQQRLDLTKKFRNESKRIATNKLAATPGLFGEIRQPGADYIIIPKVSSETRNYIPIGIISKEVITSGSALIIQDKNIYTFGIVTSQMHMTWMKYTCGRMKSDYQYSASIVYNNFPWPKSNTNEQKEAVEKAAQQVLDARAQFPDSSLADLYDPNTMPPVLVKAHRQLDKAVDLCYGVKAFASEAKRMEFLFELYEGYVEGKVGKERSKMPP